MTDSVRASKKTVLKVADFIFYLTRILLTLAFHPPEKLRSFYGFTYLS